MNRCYIGRKIQGIIKQQTVDNATRPGSAVKREEANKQRRKARKALLYAGLTDYDYTGSSFTGRRSTGGGAAHLYRWKAAHVSRYKVSDPDYHTQRWYTVRAQALQRDGGLCRDCLDRVKQGRGGKVRRATIVHHVIPKEERPDLAFELSNLRSVCAICHNQRHPEKGRRQQETPKPRMRVIKV